MIIFYSGEENKSIPEDIEYEMAEYLMPNANIMLTYWIHCQRDNPSMRFRRLRLAREQELDFGLEETEPKISPVTSTVERTRLF
jgi:hypothetical protein